MKKMKRGGGDYIGGVFTPAQEAAEDRRMLKDIERDVRIERKALAAELKDALKYYRQDVAAFRANSADALRDLARDARLVRSGRARRIRKTHKRGKMGGSSRMMPSVPATGNTSATTLAAMSYKAGTSGGVSCVSLISSSASMRGLLLWFDAA